MKKTIAAISVVIMGWLFPVFKAGLRAYIYLGCSRFYCPGEIVRAYMNLRWACHNIRYNYGR